MNPIETLKSLYALSRITLSLSLSLLVILHACSVQPRLQSAGKKHPSGETLNGIPDPHALQSSDWKVVGVERTRLVVDSTYEAAIPASLNDYLQPFTHVVDSISSPVVGYTASAMGCQRPESPLSNLLADIMLWAGTQCGEHPQIGIYNMGGIRASLPRGKVTYGQIVDVAPFDNYVCFLDLTGNDLLELFAQIAARGGEGVSHGVELTITADGQLWHATLNGQPIQPQATYRIATIDYLAKGNDQLTAFKKKRNYRIPALAHSEARHVITSFFQEKMRAGQVVTATVEGRVTVCNPSPKE